MEINREYLKEVRIKNKASQASFAQKIGVTQSLYAKWENGHRNPKHIYSIPLLNATKADPKKLFNANYDVEFRQFLHSENTLKENYYKQVISDLEAKYIESKKAHEEEINKLGKVFNCLNEYVYVKDKHLKLKNYSSSLYNLFGISEPINLLNFSFSTIVKFNEITDIINAENEIIQGIHIKEREVKLPLGKIGILSGEPCDYKETNIETILVRIKDITIEKNEQKLQDLINKVISSSPFPISIMHVTNKHKRYDYISPSVYDIIGYTNDDIISGRVNYLDIVHPEDAKEIRKWNKNPSAPYKLIYRLKPKGSATYNKIIEEHVFIDRDMIKEESLYCTYIREIKD